MALQAEIRGQASAEDGAAFANCWLAFPNAG